MAYTGGNAGYVRRLGKILSTTPSIPTEPVAGYNVWFDAGTNVYSDSAGTVAQTVDTGEIRAWRDRANAANIYLRQSADNPNYCGALVANIGNSKPGVRLYNGGGISTALSSEAGVLDLSNELGLGSGMTGFAVYKTVDHSLGDYDGILVDTLNTMNLTTMRFMDGHLAIKFGGSGWGFGDDEVPWDRDQLAIITFGTDGSTTTYMGINDTRTASLYTKASGGVVGGVAYWGFGGSYVGPTTGPLDGYLGEVVLYPGWLSEANRMLTEQYLANKYGITLPY